MVAMQIIIRDYQTSDARALTDIFYDAVHEMAAGYYTPTEINAWAPLPRDYALWQQRLDNKPPFVAIVDEKPAGFIRLENNGHIDWTYTHKDYQRQGIATALYSHLEQQARQRDIGVLYVEASHLARPFYEKQGFSVVRRNEICRGHLQLINWSMQKSLAQGSSAVD